MRGIMSVFCLCAAVCGLLQIPVSSYAGVLHPTVPSRSMLFRRPTLSHTGSPWTPLATSGSSNSAGANWPPRSRHGDLHRDSRHQPSSRSRLQSQRRQRAFHRDEYNNGHYGVWFSEGQTLREYASGLPAASTVDCSLDPGAHSGSVAGIHAPSAA